jgi:catechol 2,3-dioxygenase
LHGISPPGAALPADTHVGGVHLQVSDLARSQHYYEQIIGLRSIGSSASAVVLAPHDDDRPLVTLHSRPGVTRARRGAYGLYHFAILLPDRAPLGRFASHLASAEERVAMADHLVSEALYLWDPDGLGIEVYADRPRRTWQYRENELVMTTDPLDIRSVVAAGGGTAWTGAPPGTTIGHVHLHVGSLEGAEAFYHRQLGLDKTVWSYPGALFMSAGGYHHHLATNIWSHGPAPAPDEAQLVEWELVVPGAAEETLADPWGTRVHIRPEAA